ncbi:RHS repeat-associated core domain-containing protein [Arsenophonus endosymbiont of Aleurodicus floccissimus]|uniref:RHS repeat-associated core domain-containing protein n=1 Tax=Arsenophonus endosymbiont of Aleurodicus floccissimus TaxID=2152761 RepID=UPI001EDDDB64|nr:RHS repeat-associated core domain-containing protein [Arsenophonus endosymbiont of Aleurodicus floccissimus]
MRFNCPDNLSPFGAGGINPYAYCSGDPINHTDPSGHLSWQAITGIIAGTIGLGLAVFTAGSSIAAAGGVMVALSSASASSLIIPVGLGVASDIMGIASGAMEDSNPEASATLGWVSLATGLAVGIGNWDTNKVFGKNGSYNLFRSLRISTFRPDDYNGGPSFFAGNGTNRTLKWHPISHSGKVIYVSDQ